MKKNDTAKSNRFVSFYHKLNQRCDKFLNELLDDSAQGKPSLLDRIRAKFTKCKAKGKQ